MINAINIISRNTFGGSFEILMRLLDGFFERWRGAVQIQITSHTGISLTHVWISVTCGGGDPLTKYSIEPPNEIIHSLIFLSIKWHSISEGD